MTQWGERMRKWRRDRKTQFLRLTKAETNIETNGGRTLNKYAQPPDQRQRKEEPAAGASEGPETAPEVPAAVCQAPTADMSAKLQVAREEPAETVEVVPDP